MSEYLLQILFMVNTVITTFPRRRPRASGAMLRLDSNKLVVEAHMRRDNPL